MLNFNFCVRIFVVIVPLLVQNGDTSNLPRQALPPMGREMRAEFLHAADYTPLNHGAYGTFPRRVQTALRQVQERIESNADLWIRIDARIEMDKVRAQIASLLKADASDIVVVPNTTSGMNAILRSMIWQRGDKIMHFSTVYGAMKSLIQYVCDTSNGTVTSIEMPVTYPITNAALMAQFEAFVTANHNPASGSRIRLALFDHVTSVPHVINLIQAFTSYLKERGILTLIDGAHAVGQVEIDLATVKPDYYITNAHKWFYAARSGALLYVDKVRQATIHPAIISSNYDKNGGRFQDEFFWTGTIDYSPYITIPAALAFRAELGGEAVIRNYTHALAKEGGAYLAGRFRTRILQEDEQMGSCVDVQLPIQVYDHPLIVPGWFDEELIKKRNLFTGVYQHGGAWWIRVSTQIYNSIEDFHRAGDVFTEICDELNAHTGSSGGSAGKAGWIVHGGAATWGYLKWKANNGDL
ncbi:L-cysteine desulfhydrase-like protein lolT1 isoform X2 [Folsomia candida]|nr:L-cysteine desulfhydrase-like protein lolT1 isoform X2 [Folsomia candida]